MGKQISYTRITALPSNIPRRLAIDLLHSHEELIRLNNLVTDVQSVPAPPNADADEYFAEWYQVTESLPVLPGMKKKIVFKVCFYNQSWGVQSHQIMPGLIEMRNSHRIGGNEEGEAPEAKELGVKKPSEGLYIREDISVDLKVPFMGPFVKKTTQEALEQMVERIKRKAELLDEGRLLAMFENGKLKTTKAATPNLFDTPASTSSAAGAGRMPEMMQRTGTFSPIFQSPRESMLAEDVVRNSAYGVPEDPSDVQAWINRTSAAPAGLGITSELPAEEAPMADANGSVIGELPADAVRPQSPLHKLIEQSRQAPPSRSSQADNGQPMEMSSDDVAKLSSQLAPAERERLTEVPRGMSLQPVKVQWV